MVIVIINAVVVVVIKMPLVVQRQVVAWPAFVSVSSIQVYSFCYSINQQN